MKEGKVGSALFFRKFGKGQRRKSWVWLSVYYEGKKKKDRVMPWGEGTIDHRT